MVYDWTMSIREYEKKCTYGRSYDRHRCVIEEVELGGRRRRATIKHIYMHRKYRCVQQLYPCSMLLIKGVRFLLFNDRTTYIFYYIWLSSFHSYWIRSFTLSFSFLIFCFYYLLQYFFPYFVLCNIFLLLLL